MDLKMMTLLGLTGLSAAGTLSAGPVPRCLASVPGYISEIVKNFEDQLPDDERAAVVPRCLASIPGNISEIVKNFEDQLPDDGKAAVVPRCLATVPVEIKEILKNFEGQILTKEKINLVEKLIEVQMGSDSTPAE